MKQAIYYPCQREGCSNGFMRTGYNQKYCPSCGDEETKERERKVKSSDRRKRKIKVCCGEPMVNLGNNSDTYICEVCGKPKYTGEDRPKKDKSYVNVLGDSLPFLTDRQLMED